MLELLNDLVEKSSEVKEELLEDQLLLRPCLDCLASPSEAAVESAMELLMTLSEDKDGEGLSEEQYKILEEVAEEASSMGFLLGYLNGPTAVLRRCAADCLANLTSLPNFVYLLHESGSGGKPSSSQLMQFLATRVADSTESPEVRQLSCQILVNTLHARPSGALQATPSQLLVRCLPSAAGPEDGHATELTVLTLLALSYTFPAQPSAVDIFLSSGVFPLVFSQLKPWSEGNAPQMQSDGGWRVGTSDSWGGDKGACAAAAAILGLMRQSKRKLLVHQNMRVCGGAQILAETFQQLVKTERSRRRGLQSEVAETLLQIFAEFCLDSDDESHRRMSFPALSVASLLPFTSCESPLVSAASIYVLSSAYRSTPPAQFRDAEEQSQVSEYPSIMFELWSGSVVRSNAAREAAMKAYKSQVRSFCSEMKARPLKMANQNAAGDRQLPRVTAQKFTHRHLFQKELEHLTLANASAPKKESLSSKRRVTNIADIQKKTAKEGKKLLTDSIRRKTFAAGTLNKAARQSTLRNNHATITSKMKTDKPADKIPTKQQSNKLDQTSELHGRIARLEKENRDLNAANKCNHEKIAFLEEQNTNLCEASKISMQQRESLSTQNEVLKEEIVRIETDTRCASNGLGLAEQSFRPTATRGTSALGIENPVLQRQSPSSSAAEIKNHLLKKLQAEQAEIENIIEGQLALPLQEREKMLKKRCAELMDGWADAAGNLAEQIDAIESLLDEQRL